MTGDEVNKMLDAVKAYGELFGGLRKQFIAQGFSPEVAEQMTLEILRTQARTGKNE